VNRGKRLSRSNIIGEKGELLFRGWALDHQLVANKATTDIGIDFFCQVVEPVSGSRSLEGKGPILGAQVKTAGEGDARLTIDRIDATDLLRQTHATCLFGIRLSDKSVRFRFLDRSFIDQLIEFLNGRNKQLSIAYKDLSDDADLFVRLLKRYTNPFELNQLRIHLIQRRLNSGIPGSRLMIESTADYTLQQISVPWIASAFLIDPEAREDVRLKFLRDGYFDLDQEGVALHPAIGQALRETNSSRARVLGGNSIPALVKVQFQNEYAVETFDYREFGSQRSFTHSSGLRITMDRVTVQGADGYRHHPMESEVFRPKRPTPVTGKALMFFRIFRAGATIELQPGWKVPLETFGESLTSIGDAIAPWPDLCAALKLELRRLCLGDLHDEEFSRSAWMLEALLLKDLPLGAMVNGFLVGPAADLPIAEIPTESVVAIVPIGLNWQDVGIVVWLECEADAFFWEDAICGIRLKKHLSWQIRKTERFEKSIYPEMWFRKDWPAVPLREGLEGVSNWNYDGTQRLPFEATIRCIEPESES
jgi:hypothetical protein